MGERKFKRRDEAESVRLKNEFRKRHFGPGTRPETSDRCYTLLRACQDPKEQRGPRRQKALP